MYVSFTIQETIIKDAMKFIEFLNLEYLTPYSMKDET